MKVLSTISACAFTFLLLLGPVMGANMLKCPSEMIFFIKTAKEYAKKATLDYWNESHPLGPDGQKCKANQFSILLANERTYNKYLAQVCSTIDNYRIYEWHNSDWVICELYNDGVE
ncbi:unnamed protein product [Blumeria hordei]|uniref:Uncharacterized protein n=1 Tax=Blumeria hordei TaxID=2867405 RepID=A0A383UQQ3_BLUHO|nr:unnamed protein product [Blumeria hordei]